MRKKSFTLVEILVVATIIALLITSATVSYSWLSKQSRDGRRKADLEQIRSALEMYRSDNNKYLPNDSVYNENCLNITWLGSYISLIPSDPKTNFYYRCVISQNDYTIGAYLEGRESSCGTTISCGSGTNCNYCLGPYGKK